MSNNKQDENGVVSSVNKALEPELPDDGHGQWDWKTKYEEDAWKKINREAIYLGILLVLGVLMLILNYLGVLYDGYTLVDMRLSALDFLKEMYCVIFGFLGGTVYGIKILYKAVAQGKWHRDRLLWRIFTPWVSLILSIVVASTMTAAVFSENNYSAIVIGFFAGYFSESAIGKLFEIARIMFS